MKRVEFSENMKDWKTQGVWTDEEAKENWPKLQEWVEQVQPYGFFRMVEITEEEYIKEACVSGLNGRS